MNQFYKLILAASLGAFLITTNAAAETVVYLFRHAEKQSDGTPDPSLTTLGVTRAATLAQQLSNVPLNVIYSTAYKRTQETAAPTARQHQLAVLAYDPRQLPAFAVRLKQGHGPVLVVGHSNTTPYLVSLLSGKKHAALKDHQYDHLYKVTIAESGEATVLLTYIQPRTP